MHQLKRWLFAALALWGLVLLFAPGLRADIAGLLCFRSIGCITGDGQDVCVDTDNDGVPCEPGEPNLTMNAPNNDAGDETVQGNLVVVGTITETGVTHMHERILFDFSTASGSGGAGTGPPIPDDDDCWPLRGDFVMPIDFNASNPNPSGIAPEGRCRQQIAYDIHITRICGTVMDGAMPTSSGCKIEFYTATNRASPLAVIDVRPTTGNLPSLGSSYCVVPTTQDINAPATLYAQAATDNGTGVPECNVNVNWPEVYFQILGYGVDIP